VVVVAWVLLACAQAARAEDRYPVSGMVLSADSARRAFVASIEAIPGFMAAMTMPFAVRDAKELNGLVPGALVQFTLVVDRTASYAEGIRIRRYESVEQDPLAARRLSLLKQIASGSRAKALGIGDAVPGFTLTDQKSRRLALAELRGKVVAINFMYTACQLPDFCLRVVNHFGVLRKRFSRELGRELMFLTITFDPARDQPDVLDRYSNQWAADPATWRFLTGSPGEIRRVLDLFGVAAFPDEGLMDHSLHTVLIDRTGRMVANVEGNQYSSDQLGDLVASVLASRPRTTK
jgi:protein SCO1/2